MGLSFIPKSALAVVVGIMAAVVVYLGWSLYGAKGEIVACLERSGKLAETVGQREAEIASLERQKGVLKAAVQDQNAKIKQMRLDGINGLAAANAAARASEDDQPERLIPSDIRPSEVNARIRERLSR